MHNPWDIRYRKDKDFFGDEIDHEIQCIIDNLPKGSSVLDAGCGLGRNGLYLLKRGYNIYFLDYSQEALTRVKQHNPKSKTILSDLTNLPFRNESFDSVIAMHVLHCIPNKERKAVKEFYRILKNDGMMIAKVRSVKDSDYGRGILIGDNTYLKEDGLSIHFFEPEEYLSLFEDLFYIDNFQQEEVFDRSHGEPHTHNFLSIIARKKRCL